MNGANEPRRMTCPVCRFTTDKPQQDDLGEVRGNTERYQQAIFRLWKCPECLSIVSIDPVDFQDIYHDYPLNQRKLDIFAQGTLRNLLQRLRKAGMKPTDSVLDYGCGNGLFIDYLEKHRYRDVSGFDPYVPKYARMPKDRAPFDVIINNDTLEHCEDVYEMVRQCLDLLKPSGFLYLGTADSEPVDMADLEPHVMRLHQPFHRVIMTEQSLHKLAAQFDLEVIGAYRRSYQDTRMPFANYRFLDELNKALGHNLDRALDPAASSRAFLFTPRLWFYALFGYWFPSAAEPAIVVRKHKASDRRSSGQHH